MNTVRKLWENSNIKEAYPDLFAGARFDEPMGAHTTFRIGGPADLFALPSSVDELRFLLEFFSREAVPVSLVGGGSNILVADRGIRGAVVSLENLSSIAQIDSPAGFPAGKIAVCAEAGATMKALTEWCADSGLAGFERFAGLPGTVGGAVFMNARCYESSISDVFFEGASLLFQCGRCTLEKAAFRPDEWAYKKSPFQNRSGSDSLVVASGSRIVLSAVFACGVGESAALRADMDHYVQDREEKGHFRFPSAGSMFRNNHAFGKPSGKIVDEAGLRGFRVGDAEVAPWHGNFVINAGNASARDVRDLVEEVRRRVLEQTGCALECEVIFAGEWD
jgi:UDP-N-acetylmuramate dehydrogenase